MQIADADALGGTTSAGVGGAGAVAGGGASTGGTAPESGAAGEGGAPDAPKRRILADSVADFSLTQGEHGWYYGIDTGDIATFTLMGRQSTITSFKPPSGDMWRCWASETTHWAQLFQLGGHPNGLISSAPSDDILERAVRRWISNYTGRALITGELAKIDLNANDSDGIEGKVLLDGVELYSQALEPTDGAGTAFTLEVDLREGSAVDFVLDPTDGHDHHDLTRFTATIVTAPESP